MFFTFNEDDLFYVNPTIRTIEIANIITSDLTYLIAKFINFIPDVDKSIRATNSEF